MSKNRPPRTVPAVPTSDTPVHVQVSSVDVPSTGLHSDPEALKRLAQAHAPEMAGAGIASIIVPPPTHGVVVQSGLQVLSLPEPGSFEEYQNLTNDILETALDGLPEADLDAPHPTMPNRAAAAIRYFRQKEKMRAEGTLYGLDGTSGVGVIHIPKRKEAVLIDARGVEVDLGRVAFDAYGNEPSKHGPWTTFDGRPMPRWDALEGEAGKFTQARWRVAAASVLLADGESVLAQRLAEVSKPGESPADTLGRALSALAALEAMAGGGPGHGVMVSVIESDDQPERYSLAFLEKLPNGEVAQSIPCKDVVWSHVREELEKVVTNRVTPPHFR